jgi:DNA-binding GntR family transcriptional regulator
MRTSSEAKTGTRQKRVVGINAALNQSLDLSGERSANANPLDRLSNLQDAAYERMRQALMDGHFVPGQRFTIRALATVFGTSPMPVRDALKRLVAERALDLGPNRSVVLPVMSRARFLEILEIRLALEPKIALRAASKITPDVIEGMAQDHGAMCQALETGNASQYLVCNRRFHFRLYEAAETQVMLPVVESMWMQIGPHLNQIFRARDGAAATADHHHNALLRALRRQDAQGAAKALSDDLCDAADAILAGNHFSTI